MEIWSEREAEKNLQENVVKVAISLDVLENVIEHHTANAESSIRVQTSQGHDVEPPLVSDAVDPATNCANNNVIVISKFC